MPLLFLFLTLLAAAFGSEDAPFFKVETSGAAQVSTDPGQVLTQAFTLRSPLPVTLRPHATLPDGWTLLAPLEAVQLDGREPAVRLVSMRVPSDTPAGIYPVVFHAYGEGEEAQTTVRVEVRRRDLLDLELKNFPTTVEAGTDYSALLQVVNLGNADTPIFFTVEGVTLRQPLNGSAPHLAPRETIEIPVSLQFEETAATVRVSVHSSLIGPPLSTEEHTVQVRPAPQLALTPAQSVPVYVGAKTYASGEEAGVQAIVQGAGQPFANRPDVLSFLARYPGRDGVRNVFVRQDEFRLTYEAQRFGVQLGDGIYRLSPLTEVGRYGFGGGGFAQLGRLFRDRFRAPNALSDSGGEPASRECRLSRGRRRPDRER